MNFFWKLSMCSLLVIVSSYGYAWDDCVFYNHAERRPNILEKRDIQPIELLNIMPEGVCSPYAAVRDSRGSTYYIFLGDFIGADYGLVQDINKNEVLIREILEGRNDEWYVRMTRMRYKKSSEYIMASGSPVLKNHKLDSFRLSKTVFEGKCKYAILVDICGYEHRVFLTDVVGKERGIVSKIDANSIRVKHGGSYTDLFLSEYDFRLLDVCRPGN
jgi:Tfp pilus assembly protein PilP